MTENSTLYKGISKLLWGFVFIFFHITINSVDLLPDFVGYILLAVGIGSLGAELGHIKILKPLSVVIAVWTAIWWIAGSIVSGGIIPEGFFSTFLSYLSTAMGIVMLIFNIILLTDLSQIAAKYQSEGKNIDRKLIVARNLYAVCYSVSIAISISALLTIEAYSEIITGLMMAVSVPVAIAMLVTMIIVLVALVGLRKEIAQRDIESVNGIYTIPPFDREDTGNSDTYEEPGNEPEIPGYEESE